MVFAALMRHEDETLDELHGRLDDAAGQVMCDEIEAVRLDRLGRNVTECAGTQPTAASDWR